MDRAADNHYPTLSTEDISALGVAAMAADDSVLFLWATAPMFPDALVVMQAWGFRYRSQAVWDKGRVGTGYWFRNRHELLLVGVRGSVPAPAPGKQLESIIAAPAREHSVKPDCFLKLIDDYFPTLPKIELFARGSPRPGWDAWGNEVDQPGPATAPDELCGIHEFLRRTSPPATS
jgi:N6-adenosine-specific RNA methylase IME4